MNEQKRTDSPGSSPEAERSSEPEEQLHSYAGGEITERSGIVNKWLLAVYFALLVWSLYYLFTEWRGLGPGLGIPGQ
ncbi:MAG: hypothetical protein GWN99_00725 [Gemmatimonadetes bacterium]|uniref:Uncharacterized protein n=1 Tax=Candidatus Kutchimonas denitrificans TaxID=3056748 RepID=A0AAE4Z6I6_9BACT|nr:hypothetical protein [Gemmatimonadota bacterium]NIR73632.1 hypothetical protein [Candidatus Kutchimonas denitrificans]NIR99591.1 hypothetical protein [Gemmatimonadota bacterium]NIT65211.1 hypothetical protein [Gemmatimonadota bacterium]NIV23744.1 hypothetical protein [Gemmatimonadota bacterium]